MRLLGRPSARRLVLLVSALSLSAGGCANDGRELAEPQDWQTTTTRPLPPTSAPERETGVEGVELSSPDFDAGAMAPVDVTCSGANRSPALRWTTPAATTGELALALIDQTTPDNPVLLWLVVGIDPSVTELAAGELPPGAVETLNDYGQPGWGNPCLETISDGLRDLQFRLYLLDTPTGIQAGAAGNEAWDIVTASAGDSASILMRVDAAV